MLIHKQCGMPVGPCESSYFGTISTPEGRLELIGFFCPQCNLEVINDEDIESFDVFGGLYGTDTATA